VFLQTDNTEERKSIEYLHSIFICDRSFSQADKTELKNLLIRMDRIFLASKKYKVWRAIIIIVIIIIVIIIIIIF
jgi:hypothetical protein